MERQPTSEGHDPWRETWDAVPRDGPALFVIDVEAFDTARILRGRWIDPTAEPAIVELQLQELLGRWPEPGTWVVVDQVGVGSTMVPEDVTLNELSRVRPDREAAS